MFYITRLFETRTKGAMHVLITSLNGINQETSILYLKLIMLEMVLKLCHSEKQEI